MSEKTQEQLVDPKKLSIFKVTWPIFLEILLLMLLGNVDVWMLSQYSDEAVAGVGVANQIIGTALTMFGFVSVGAAVIISQYIGAKKPEDAKRVSMIAILSNLAFGLVISAVYVIFRFQFLNLMQVEDYLIGWGQTVILIVGGFVFIQAVLLTAGSILRSHGYTRDMLYVTLVMNVFNAAGNAIVIFGLFGVPVLGVTGVAWVTAASKLLGMIIAIVVLMRRIPGIFSSLKTISGFPIHYIKQILRIGLPAAGENLSFQSYQLVVTTLVATIGTFALTTMIYARMVNFFILLFTISIAQGGSIIMGQLMGAKEYDEIYHRCFKYLRFGIVASFTGALLLFIFYRPILGIFTDDPEILSTARLLFAIGVLLETGRAFNIIIINGLRATGDAKFPALMAVIFMWGVGAFGAWLFGIFFGLGLPGILIGSMLDEWIRGIIMFFRWRSRVWQKMGAIGNDEDPLEEVTA